MFTGKDIIGISLPVRIFEPRSMAERITDWYGYAPLFLKEAGQIQDPIERFKLTIAYAISGMYLQIQLLKPFNPLLGETYQANLPDGTKIYVEHTSHHPPVSNFEINDPENLYQLFGYYEYKAKIKAGYLLLQTDGPNHIVYTNQK